MSKGSMKSGNESGKDFERYIAGMLNEIDKSARPTKGSGAHIERGDILNSLNLKIECKYRSATNCLIKKSIWYKLCSQLALHNNNIPILFLKNKDSDVFAVLDIRDFITIYKRYWNGQK